MLKKRILTLILIVSGILLLSFPAYADDSSYGYHLSSSSTGVGVGDYIKLSAYFGSSVDNNTVWSSADQTVATVGSDGTVTGKKIGQTIVTAHSGAYSSSCVINVAYQGIDVSKYQGTIDWSAVKNYGIDFAMLRTGFGGENWSTQTDSCFAANYTNAKSNGIKVGVYHYSYATSVAMAQQEADLCLHVLNGRQLDYPVAYDVEDKCQYGLSSDTLGQIVQAFCSKIQAAGYKTVVYSYYNFYKAHLTSPLVAQYDTWIAHSTDRTDFSPYTMWQYGQRTVPGVSGPCDVDYSFYDYSGTESQGGTSSPVFPEPSKQIFTCDTTGTYTFGTNKIYYYKITTNDTITPSASSSDPSVVSVSYYKQLSDGYLFKIVNNGSGQAVITTTAGDGVSVSFTAVGGSSGTQSNGFSPINSGSTLKCDTTMPYTFGSNDYYIYKVYTSSATRPTASSSNPAAVTVAFYQKASDGYLFRIANAGTGKSVITTAVDGQSVSFTANGTKQKVSAGTLNCDTTLPYTFGSNRYYIYKVYTSSATRPTASSSNPAAVTVAFYQKASDGYLFRIANAGTGKSVITTAVDGQSVSFTANGTLSNQLPDGIKSDTPYLFSMTKGKTYSYKITPADGNQAYSFTTGNRAVIQTVSVTKLNGSYYYKIKAVGSGEAGVYASATGKTAQRLGIVTVS